LTPEDLQLDPQLFINRQPLILFRLARARYANLSGAGAAFAPGRWNRIGQEAIYTSTEMGVPLLERLVHTPKDLVPSNLAMMKIRMSGNWEMQKNAMIDPQTSGCMWFYRDLATAKDRFKDGPSYFAVGMGAFAVALPSVIVPVWNVVLFPQGRSFWEHISLESVEPFKFDPRLFPEGAAAEPPDIEKSS
jgi:RES domain-containing protein